MNYRMLTKMSIQSGKGWFELLPAAVFKMNVVTNDRLETLHTKSCLEEKAVVLIYLS